MTKTSLHTELAPTTEKQRYVILDSLRGLALLGICLANLPEFSLWTFLPTEARHAMPTAAADHVVRFLQYFLVDAKFYCIFSILFGIGFSIILAHAEEKGNNGIRLFYRRMAVLMAIALVHLLFIWSGDILCLYALAGMILPILRRLSDRRLLTVAAACIFLPVLLDLWQELAAFSFAQPIVDAWWSKAHSYGINEGNFATWLRDADSYGPVHRFLMQGAIERMYEFVDGHRLLKVLGFFIVGYVIGRNRLYARLEELRPRLRTVCLFGFAIGLPASFLYALSAVNSHPWGLSVHSLLYTLSALPLAMGYITALSLFFLHRPSSFLLHAIAKPGRMALSNYIGQSIIGIIIYYGIGFGLGLSMGLWQVELTAVAIFIVQIALSACCLRFFRFGPLEWIWRMLTYGRRFSIRR